MTFENQELTYNSIEYHLLFSCKYLIQDMIAKYAGDKNFQQIKSADEENFLDKLQNTYLNLDMIIHAEGYYGSDVDESNN